MGDTVSDVRVEVVCGQVSGLKEEVRLGFDARLPLLKRLGRRAFTSALRKCLPPNQPLAPIEPSEPAPPVVRIGRGIAVTPRETGQTGFSHQFDKSQYRPVSIAYPRPHP